MLRLLLIAVLLLQMPLTAIAASGAACSHTASAEAAAASAGHHAQHAGHDNTEPSDGRPLCDCACDVAGHCSSTAVGSILRAAGTGFSLRSDRPATTTDATASGFRTHPYRPPSASA